jgi:fatty acid desaturase
VCVRREEAGLFLAAVSFFARATVIALGQKVRMTEDTRTPQINSAKIPISGNMIGAIVAVGSMAIFLIGLPVLWYIFPIAVALGLGVALVLHFVRHKSPGAPWILASTKK